jgi:hypothetical protein
VGGARGITGRGGSAIGAVAAEKDAHASAFPEGLIPVVYVVTEADAAAIREVYERDGELSAAIELRRRFPKHHGQRGGR